MGDACGVSACGGSRVSDSQVWEAGVSSDNKELVSAGTRYMPWAVGLGMAGWARGLPGSENGAAAGGGWVSPPLELVPFLQITWN